MLKARFWLVMMGGIAVGCGGCQSSAPDWPRVERSVPAPEFSLPALDGNPIRLSDYRGQVVIMEFWATWCGPCRYSMPSLEHIYRKFQGRGVAVLLINQGESLEQIRTWLPQRITAPILLDRDQALGRRYAIPGLPTLVVVGQQGEILYVRSGYRGGLERDLTWILENLLKPSR